MKQKIYIAVLLAGMLALAGCGGGSSGISEEEAAERAAAAVAEAEAKAAEEAAAAAAEAAAKIVTDASADIDAATTLVEVDAVIKGLDQGAISSEAYITLQGEATTKKGMITTDAVDVAIVVIKAQDDAADVDFQLRTAKENNPNIPADDTAAQGRLDMAATDRKTAIQMAADQQRDTASNTAVQAAITAINAATTLAQVDTAEGEADNNAAIKQEEKDKDADDAGSYQMAAAAKRAELNNPVQLTALKAAGEELTTKLGAATDAKDAVTQEQIEAVEAALGTLKTRITEATDVANTDKASYEGQRAAADGDTGQIATLKSRLAQVNALNTANTKLTNARQAAGDTPTRAQLNTVLEAHGELKTALDNAAQVLDKSTYQTAFDTASGWAEVQDTRITGLETQQNNQENADALAMTLKLWDAIGEDGNKGTVVDTDTPTGATANDGLITIDRPDPDGDGGDGDPGAIELKASKTVVAPLHGWVGSEQTLTVPDDTDNDNGTYTARLYSNVGKATEGGKFNADGTLDATDDGAFADGVLTLASGGEADRIASPTFDRDVPTSGPRFYKLPDPNPLNAPNIPLIQGSYFGVSGRYTCNPTADATGCSVTKASEGYTLGGGVWTFTPNEPEDRVTEMPDNEYNVYGWWLHEDDEGKATVSAFTAVRNNEDNDDPDVAAATGLTAFTGTATYKGGAAGKYAIRAGSTNDAGHFIADATLNANFTEDEISGTINNFKVGDDGESRDWSIALEESDIGDTGLIRDAGDDDDTVVDTDSGAMTTWKMNDTDTNATKSGDWTGQLRNNIAVGEDGAGTPQSATGIFHSEYNNTGRMVGAFGVNLDNN